jgi:hypothetical protein
MSKTFRPMRDPSQTFKITYSFQSNPTLLSKSQLLRNLIRDATGSRSQPGSGAASSPAEASYEGNHGRRSCV